MSNIRKVYQQLDFIDRFRGFSLSYQQVTMVEMTRIRDKVLQTREHMEGLQDVFIDVKNDHKRKIIELKKKNKDNNLSFSTLKKTKQNAVIFFSVSTKFSSFLNKTVFDKLAKYLKKNDADIFVFGEIGANIIRNKFPNKKIILIDSNKENSNVKEIITKLLLYKNVEVFFPKFHNLLNQEVVSTNLTGEESILDKEREDTFSRESEKRRFLFEPSLESILNFFEVEVFKSLFDKSLEESYLAHLGARLTTFESIQQSVDKSYDKTKKLYLRVKKDFNNKKQRERISGILLWN